MPRPEKNDKNAPSDAQVERWLYHALRLGGELLPASIEDVSKLEAEIEANPVALPESLRDASAVYEQIHTRTRPPSTIPLPVQNNVAEGLARAAREGGEISSEVQAKMREDREAAEREQEHSE